MLRPIVGKRIPPTRVRLVLRLRTWRRQWRSEYGSASQQGVAKQWIVQLSRTATRRRAEGRGHSSGMTHGHALGHASNRGVRVMCCGKTAPGNQKVVNLFR